MRQIRPRERVKESNDKHAINEDITAPNVRVVGVDGEQLGILNTREALRLAEEAGVDLVEVAPGSDPPVCRMLDYGKLKYREQKKAADARKRAATHSVKEIRVRYNTDKHDLDTKVRNARKFLEEGDKVRFQMRFKGRESVYKDLGEQVFKQIAEHLNDIALIEESTPLLGQRMTMTIGPRSGAAK
ncbi:MAG: translation initiation factor IF-3 [Bdellovibrionota bacterium]